MDDEGLKLAEIGRFLGFAYKRFLFAAAFFMLLAKSVCFGVGGFIDGNSLRAAGGGITGNTDAIENMNIIRNINAAASADGKENAEKTEDVGGETDELTPGHVRLLTKEIYFLENTELEFETYGDEKVYSVTYTYCGKNDFAMADGDGRVFMRICRVDGFSGGEDEIEMVVQTDYDPQDGETFYENRCTLKLIFYDAVFRYSEGGTYYISGAPAELFPELRAEASEASRARFDKTVAENIAAIKIFVETVARPLTDKDGNVVEDKDGKVVLEISEANEELTSAVFPNGLSGNSESFFEALTAVFGDGFSEIYEIGLKIEYRAEIPHSGGIRDESILIKTRKFTLRRLEKSPETRESMISALESFVDGAGRGGAIDAEGLKSALDLDEMILNSFERVSLVCEILKGGKPEKTLTVDLKSGDGGSYILAADEYKFVFRLYLDGELFFGAESEKNIRTTFFEELDGSPEGIVKVVTVAMGASILLFTALAAVVAVYRKKSGAKAGQRRSSGSTVLADGSRDCENEGKNTDKRDYSKRAVLNERSYDYESSVGRTVLNDRSHDYEGGGYDYMYEDEPTDEDCGSYIYEERSEIKERDRNENRNRINALKGKNADDMKERDSDENRGFSYEKLIKDNKKFSLGENLAGFDEISKSYASSGNGNRLKAKLSEKSENYMSDENRGASENKPSGNSGNYMSDERGNAQKNKPIEKSENYMSKGSENISENKSDKNSEKKDEGK
jgi:hypothetical protein